MRFMVKEQNMPVLPDAVLLQCERKCFRGEGRVVKEEIRVSLHRKLLNLNIKVIKVKG